MYNALSSNFDSQASLIIIAFAAGRATIIKPCGFSPAGLFRKLKRTDMRRNAMSMPIDRCLACLARILVIPVHLHDPTLPINELV